MSRKKLTALLPVGLLVIIAVLVFAFDLHKLLNWQLVSDNYATLNQYISNDLLLSSLIFIAIYTTVVSLSLPVASFMTLLGGLLFGPVLGTFLVVNSATLGAIVIFICAKTAFRQLFANRNWSMLATMEAGFKENAFSYMLVIRLVPLFPFFAVNVVPAILNVSLRVFAIATYFGIMPATFVYCLAGAGLGGIVAQGGDVSIQGILTPTLIGALIGLAALACVPIVYKRIKHRK